VVAQTSEVVVPIAIVVAQTSVVVFPIAFLASQMEHVAGDSDETVLRHIVKDLEHHHHHYN